MGMLFCRGCGKEIHETAPTCPHCGAPQGRILEASKGQAIPDGIKGWSWGAFLLSWIWAIGNKTWIGLIAIIPYVGFIMAIILGFKGREWAWKNKQWESVEQFNIVQKKWSFWGVSIVVGAFFVGILGAIAIPAYQDYAARTKQVESNQSDEEIMVPDQTSQVTTVDEIPPTAPSVTYEPLSVTTDRIGGVFTLETRELGGSAINYQSRAGVVNVMESVVEDPDATGYVNVEKAYRFGDKYLLIVSTGEYGMSCPATTYAFTYDTSGEYVSGKSLIDGCSENVEALSDGNKLTVKKDGNPSVFYNGEVN